MSIWFWEKYTVYFFDEDDGKNYLSKFIENLKIEDPEVLYIFLNAFVRRINEGIGISEESFKTKKIKELNNNKKMGKLFEYRDRSSKTNRQIRIYFFPDDKRKMIVILHGAIKENKKSQDEDIKTANKRKKQYLKRYGRR